MLECPLCLSTVATTSVVRLAGCLHRCCEPCVRQYLAIEIFEARVPINCPVCHESMHPSGQFVRLKCHYHFRETSGGGSGGRHRIAFPGMGLVHAASCVRLCGRRCKLPAFACGWCGECIIGSRYGAHDRHMVHTDTCIFWPRIKVVFVMGPLLLDTNSENIEKLLKLVVWPPRYGVVDDWTRQVSYVYIKAVIHKQI